MNDIILLFSAFSNHIWHGSVFRIAPTSPSATVLHVSILVGLWSSGTALSLPAYCRIGKNNAGVDLVACPSKRPGLLASTPKPRCGTCPVETIIADRQRIAYFLTWQILELISAATNHALSTHLARAIGRCRISLTVGSFWRFIALRTIMNPPYSPGAGICLNFPSPKP